MAAISIDPARTPRSMRRKANCTSLLPEFLADFKVRTPIFNTLCMIHRPFSNHLRIKKVDECIDFALDQCGGRVGHGQTSRSEIGLPETVAAPVAVTETVERRHAGPGTATFDGRNQVFAVKLGLAQIRAIGHLVIHLSAVTGPTVARLAICLLPEELATRRNIGSTGRLRLHSGCSD